MNPRYGIAEWYGNAFLRLSLDERLRLAELALQPERVPPPCRKRGGVCSLQRYGVDEDGQIGLPVDLPAMMPQLQIKVPTLRRWGSKMAVAADRTFFDSIGRPSPSPNHDINDGDVIWLVPEMTLDDTFPYRFSRGHWEVLTLEDTVTKLLAASTVPREAFEQDLLNKLEPLG